MTEEKGLAGMNPPHGRPPALQYAAPDELHVDSSYQRAATDPTSQTLIRKIARDWDWDLCDPLRVSRRADERLFVVDGQHRLEAARLRGDLTLLPLFVSTYASPADEARAFHRLNSDRKALNRLELFRAAVASGDEQSVMISLTIAEAGLALAPHGNHTAWQPGMVSHIGGIERAWRREGLVTTKLALTALARGFEGQVLRYGGTVWRGLVAVCRLETRREGGFAAPRFERFVALLASRPQLGWLQEMNRALAADPSLFRAEAIEYAMLGAWATWPGGGVGVGSPARRALDRAAARVSAAEQDAPVRREGFGRGAADDASDEEWAWCAQCDARRTRAQATACRSAFCKLKAAA